MLLRTVVFFVLGLGLLLPSHAQSPSKSGCESLPASTNCKLLDDFESDTTGAPPHRWRTNEGRNSLIRLTNPDAMDPKQNVYVREENGNQFARVHTEGKAFRAIMSHKRALDWDLEKRPVLQWRWRAQALPEGGNEKYDRSNDTGGALYVTVEKNWLGMPKSIKYTYSSTLPVGTTVDYGPLKVLVVASRAEQGTGEWITHERDVLADYDRLFGDNPDGQPLAIMMWSDSDTMNSVGTIDFDDLALLSQPPRSDSSPASSQ
ncbi:MAG: hypothetical protein BRD30_08950 [Bacteroidetes bacterium QH_2_63_10]|nr:MAG: hypothetical protein BRD30_08950 [Bacteroidetes bacterium QH_2_63_10]